MPASPPGLAGRRCRQAARLAPPRPPALSTSIDLSLAPAPAIRPVDHRTPPGPPRQVRIHFTAGRTTGWSKLFNIHSIRRVDHIVHLPHSRLDVTR